MTSLSTMGLVDYRSDKERIAKYGRQSRDALRQQTKYLAQQAAMPVAPAALPTIPTTPLVPPGAPAPQWNGTVWQAWNAGQNRWMIWDGYGWR
jgi:hypothetical protein